MDKQDKMKTFGCQMNDEDSEVMVRLLEREGVADLGLRLEKEYQTSVCVLSEGANVIILNNNN